MATAQPSSASSSDGDASSFRAAILSDLEPLQSVAAGYQRALADPPDDRQLRAVLDLAALNFSDARDRLSQRPPFEPAPRLLNDYRTAAHLFLESARIGRAALGLPAGGLRTELLNQCERLRTLGDRAFDKAEAELAPFRPPSLEGPGIVFEGLPETPDFSARGIAPGSPLAEPSRVRASPEPGLRGAPEQPFDAWVETVRGSGAPSAPELAAAIEEGAAPRLGEVASRFEEALEVVLSAAGPIGERRTAVGVALGLLVRAESARAAEAAALLPAAGRTDLLSSAKRLALLGDGLWDRRVDGLASGFPPELLVGE